MPMTKAMNIGEELSQWPCFGICRIRLFRRRIVVVAAPSSFEECRQQMYGEAGFLIMQQQTLRASQSDGLRHARGSVPQQQSTSQAKHEADAPSHAPNWSASKAIVWVCKGWWNSAAWWACFACGLFLWCFAYAKEDDGSDFSSTLPFLIYFTRVRLSSRNAIPSLFFCCT